MNLTAYQRAILVSYRSVSCNHHLQEAAGYLQLVREMTRMTDRFAEKQGRYLAFIDSYLVMHGRAPAEADLCSGSSGPHLRRYIR